jgi:hypothetical protein
MLAILRFGWSVLQQFGIAHLREMAEIEAQVIGG